LVRVGAQGKFVGLAVWLDSKFMWIRFVSLQAALGAVLDIFHPSVVPMHKLN
jgi:hypothetical protein